jgi:opacity protein-like surface antigen
MKKFASTTAALLALALMSAPVDAQQGTWELGVDGGFALTSFDGADDNLLNVSLPFGHFRAGYFVTNQLSIEPMLTFQRNSAGDDSFSTTSLVASGLYHFTADRVQRQFYLQAGAGLDHARGSFNGESESATQWLVGGGAGVKIPVMDQLSVRLGLLYLHRLENEDDFMPSANQFSGQIGVSLFSH